MSTMGELLASARRGEALRHWLALAPPALADALSAAALACGETPATYARVAVADFGRNADAEAWTQLLSTVQRHSDPAAACLGAMLRWRLARDAHPTHSPEEPHHDQSAQA